MTSVPSTMRAWVFETTGKPQEILKLRTDYPVPANPDYPIVIKVRAAALNPVGYKLMKAPSIVVKTPAVPEADYAGIVVGGDLAGSGLKVGDEVMGIIPADSGQQKRGIGSLAEYTLASTNTVVKKPQRLSFEEAAGVPLTSLTAYTCLLKTAKLTAGQRVLINGGTGSVGIWATQIAKAVGCFTVATCSEASFGLVKDLGADEVVDYKKDLYNTLAEKYGSTDTQRFDVVFDTIGTPELYKAAERFTKATGIFVNISAEANSAGEAIKSAIAVGDALLRPKWLGGSSLPYKLVMLHADNEHDSLKQIAQWLEEGKLKPIIDSEHAFEDALNAYDKIMSGRAKGKVIVKVAA